MIKAFITLGLIVLGSATSAGTRADLPPGAMKRLRAAYPGMTDECAKRIEAKGIDAFPSRIDQCVKMDRSKRWQGIWQTAFETSRFCPSPVQRCDYNTPGEMIWLEFRNLSMQPKLGGAANLDTLHAGDFYALDFIGRKTSMKGSYGHMGVSQQQIIVDKLISFRKLKTQRLK